MRQAIAVLFALVVFPLALACGEQGQSRIAFHSTRDGNWEVYVMNADGSGQTRLTDNPAADSAASWSPDGQRIAFVSDRDDPDPSDDDRISDIYLMNADGSGQTRLTDSSAWETRPRWSPDGRRIAFFSYRDGKTEIYVMNADGSEQTRLTDNQAGNVWPSWSPDGRRIVFVSYRDESSDVYVMNADGSGQTRLTDNSAMEMRPVWSPDGGRIAFNSDRKGNWEVYVMNADGTGQMRLTDNQASDISPIWSPNGRRIAFSSDRDDPDPNDGNRIVNIYVMNADGSGQMRLTDSSASDYAVSWSPN